MDDIFTQVREGNAFHVKVWLDNTENDLNQGDEHRFSLLHWASMMGHTSIVDMLLFRGARVNATNMGDDTALHLAAGHGHVAIVRLLLANKALIDCANEHGNTPLHYACFWNHEDCAMELVQNAGAKVSICNRYSQTPLDLARPHLSSIIRDTAMAAGQDTTPIPFREASWLASRTRTRDATLSRNAGIDIDQLTFTQQIAVTHGGTLWCGSWQGTEIAAKVLNLAKPSPRVARDFAEEYPKLRVFNHPNILPVLGACSRLPHLVLISQFMPYHSLYDVLHGESAIVVDQTQALRFSVDIARGMEFLHMREPMIPNIALTSKHVMVDEDTAKIGQAEYVARAWDGCDHAMIDEDLTARINMADYRFSFHENNKIFSPAWMSPEALQHKSSDINVRAADMWSMAVLLWELATREVPFADLSPMETGMKIALEGLRVKIPPGVSQHIRRLIGICMAEEPGKRPRFDMIIPILEKMRQDGRDAASATSEQRPPAAPTAVNGNAPP